MTAFLVTAAVAGWVGACLGFLVRGFSDQQRVVQAEVDRDLANREAAQAQAESAALREALDARPMFSTGRASPWQPVSIVVGEVAP